MMESVSIILADDGYRKLLAGEEPVPGDLVIYPSEGIIEHVGVVLEIRKLGAVVVPYVMSKWGPGPEYLHSSSRTPYGQDYDYLTERP